MKFSALVSSCLTPLLAATLLGSTGAAFADPPDRVARVSYLAGEVSFAPAGEDSWYAARINRPVVTGDRLWTNRSGRLELELGMSVVRLDEDSSFEFLNLNDQLAQIQLTEGILNLRIDHLYPGQVYEVDTPTLAFVVDQPGEYRLDIAPQGESTQVTVFDGYAEVYGEDGRNVQVQAGVSYLFHDSALSDYQRLAMPRADDFDQWAFARNDRYANSPTRRYVSEEMIGYADLGDYGSWRSVPDYGNVWFPQRVSAGWTPYRDGHWSWIDPWGWTWVDDQPWGFAPFHYGRWVYVSSGWGWIPGPRHVRPVYAPALVAFVGGSNWSLSVSTGSPIGWFPLGPRDVYVPWYHCSRDYFGRVNVHNTVVINQFNVTNIYNDYYVQGRPLRRDYTYRDAANAVTVVPRDSFVNARSAAQSMARLRPGSLQRGEILAGAPAAPTRASLVGGAAGRAAPAAAFNRQVVARTQPAPRTAPFATRQQAIARNGGAPLASDQMRQLSNRAENANASRVRVIGNNRTAASSAARAPTDRAARSTSSDTNPTGRIGRVDAQPSPVAGTSSVRDRTTAPAARSSTARNARSPVPAESASAPVQPARDARSLPSSRYVPRNGNRARESSEGIPLPPRRGTNAREPTAAPRNAEAPSARYEGSRSTTRVSNEPQPIERRMEQPRTTAPSRSPQVRESVPRAEPRASREWTAPRAESRETMRQSAPAARMETREPVRQSAPVREAPARQESAPERSARSERPARDESSRSEARSAARSESGRRER
jgi:hypothetical protein